MKTQQSVTRAAASRAATPQITFIEDDGEARFTSRGGKHHLHLRGETSRMAREMAERAGLTVEEFVVRAINARHAALVPPVPPTSAEDSGTVRGELGERILAIAKAEGITAGECINRMLEGAPAALGQRGMTITLKLTPAQGRCAKAAAALVTESGDVNEWAMEWVVNGLRAELESVPDKLRELLGVAC